MIRYFQERMPYGLFVPTREGRSRNSYDIGSRWPLATS